MEGLKTTVTRDSKKRPVYETTLDLPELGSQGSILGYAGAARLSILTYRERFDPFLVTAAQVVWVYGDSGYILSDGRGSAGGFYKPIHKIRCTGATRSLLESYHSQAVAEVESLRAEAVAHYRKES